MKNIIAMLYGVMDKRPLRALSLVMALLLAGCIMWAPARFAASTSVLSTWQGILIIWAVCASVIHGVGFRIHTVHWQVFFCPLIAGLVLIAGLIFFFAAY